MKSIKNIGALLLLLAILSSCGAANESNSKSEINIYTTIYPLQFIVESIAENTVNAETVYPPGVDEHTYEPSSKDLTDIAEGDAFIYIGAGLEAFAETAADALENQPVKLIEIGANKELFLKNEDNHNHDGHHHSGVDPHIWLDPLRMIEIAGIVTEHLIELNPESKTLYEENLDILEKELTTLDSEFQELIASKTNKQILITHAAFGYWEERYGIEQLSIHGISTENEPSQKDLISIIDTANETGIQHIIFEQNVSSRVSQTIQEEIDADMLIIHNLAVLMEEDIAKERDYFSIMRDNLDVLNKAMK